jgi:hypothetical protein
MPEAGDSQGRRARHIQGLQEPLSDHRWVPWAGCSQQLLDGRIRRSQRLAAQYEAIAQAGPVSVSEPPISAIR